MNESKAKELRKAIFGDFSFRDVNYTRGVDMSLRCVGRRAAYQRLKRNSSQQALSNQFSESPKKHAYKGKDRPRWLHPGMRGQ